VSGGRNTLGHDLVKNWGWLDPFASFFGAIVEGFYKIPGTRFVKDVLHGTWPLHHPFHPAVTDLTIGGYTAMVAVDALYLATGETGLVRAADFLLVFSLLTSLVSILSGLTDWSETYDTERRTGIFHGLLMTVASLGFLASLWLRVGATAEARPTALAISTVAWLLMLFASYFGGEMTFGFGTEVNRQAWTELGTKWEQLDLTAASLEDRKPVVAKTKGGVDLFVISLDGAVHVMGNVCTHAGGPLNEGKIVGKDRCEIECPWHGSRFCVKDATARAGPATFGEPRFESRVAGNGRLEVRYKS